MNKIEAIIDLKGPTGENPMAVRGLVGINVVYVTGTGNQLGVTPGGRKGLGRYVIDILPKTNLNYSQMMRTSKWRLIPSSAPPAGGNISYGMIFVSCGVNAIRR